jgi:hypothetical protein
VRRKLAQSVRKKLPVCVAVLAMTMATGGGGGLFAQDDNARALAERSAIVVDGRVLKLNASEEPMLATSERTAVILVLRMHAGSEVAGDQAGRNVTVILSRAGALKVGDEARFFGNPRFVGKTLTIADEGEIVSKGAAPLTDVQRGSQARKDRPVLERLGVASLVFRGTVDAVKPPEAAGEQGKRPPSPSSEHDPQWQVATVRVATLLKGSEAGQMVTVAFASSNDIVWFHAPKLKAGQDAVFIAHALNKENASRYRASELSSLVEKQPVYVVVEPSDVLPAADEARVRGLLSSGKEAK